MSGFVERQESAFELVRTRLERVDREVRAALRASAELPAIEGRELVAALSQLSGACATARTAATDGVRSFRARIAAAEETIPPEER